VFGIGFGYASLAHGNAQRPSLIFPQELAQSNSHSSNSLYPDANSSSSDFNASITSPPISPACPFPTIAASPAIVNALMGGKITTTAHGIVTEHGTLTGHSFVPGDGSDADLSMRVNSLVSAGKLAQAAQVAQKIKDVPQKNEALYTIVSAYKEAGQLERAFEAAKSMAEPLSPTKNSSDDNFSLKDNALSVIAEAYLKVGQLDQALQVAQNMNATFQVSTLLEIADKYRAVRQLNRAASIIDRAVAAYTTAPKLSSNNPEAAAYFKLLALSQFVNEYARVGRTAQAVELSSEILAVVKTLPQPNFMTLAILSGTAEVYALAGERQQAAAVLSYSLQAARNIKEIFAQALLLNEIANVYVTLKQPQQATQLFSPALGLAEQEKGVSEKNLVLIELARSYGMLGQYDKALQVTNAVEPASVRNQVNQTLICSSKTR